MKKAFVVYHDQLPLFQALNNDQVVELLMAMFQYSATGVATVKDPFARVAFAAVRATLDRDQEKYEATCQRNKANRNKKQE